MIRKQVQTIVTNKFSNLEEQIGCETWSSGYGMILAI